MIISFAWTTPALLAGAKTNGERCLGEVDHMCESTLRPDGLMQFMSRTWAANALRLGYGELDVWDARAAARVAAEMWSRGQQWQWSCSRVGFTPERARPEKGSDALFQLEYVRGRDAARA